MEKLISEAPSSPCLAAIDELRAKAAAEEEEARRRKPKGLPEDSDDVFHLAALVDLHKVYGRPVITVRESAYPALKEALEKGKDQQIVELQLLDGPPIATVDAPQFLGWAFNRPPVTEWPEGTPAAKYDPWSPNLDTILDRYWPASERIDRPATWNPLENPADAADFIELYGIAQDPRHTVRYVLGLKCPPKRPRKPKSEKPYHQLDCWLDPTPAWRTGPLAPGLAELNAINKMTEAIAKTFRCKCGNEIDTEDGIALAETIKIWWCDECGRFIQQNTVNGKVSVETYAPKQWFKGPDPA